MKQLQQFIEAYLITAAWTIEEDRTPFSPASRKRAAEDCKEFIRRMKKQLGKKRTEEILNIDGVDFTAVAGHDFLLTRNGHGAGFWDKEHIYGEKEAAILTAIARDMKAAEIYINDKNELEFI